MSGSGPLRRWAASGGMWLTGHSDGPPLAMGVDVEGPDVATYLFGRAALLGLTRNGRRSAGGSCRLLRAADSWVAVNLARPEDVASVPAILQREVDGDLESALECGASELDAVELADRAQLLGVPAAVVGGAGDLAASRTVQLGEPADIPPRPLVVDLSSLWAGPLCGHLLGLAGAEVVKVESAARPDGARSGNTAFFRWLNGDKRSVVIDFATTEGRTELRALVERADVVIEASRPRALRQLGIDADEVVAAAPGRTWLSITGYGREGDAADRVAFGDDAAVAGGLVAWDDDGAPVFCGDAIADPLTGLHAAAAVRESMASGGGRRIDVAMAGVAALARARIVDLGEHVVLRTEGGGWQVEYGDETFAVLPPRPPG